MIEPFLKRSIAVSEDGILIFCAYVYDYEAVLCLSRTSVDENVTYFAALQSCDTHSWPSHSHAPMGQASGPSVHPHS